MNWLLNNMDDDDKNSLTAGFLVDNCKYAYKAWKSTPWGSVNDSLFFEYVLPYSSLNERRDNWRKDFHERFSPIVKNANSAYEAAAILNNNEIAFKTNAGALDGLAIGSAGQALNCLLYTSDAADE